jgi:two-component system, NtrC family, nitrogen regulation sensor histidine kinase GlnL
VSVDALVTEARRSRSALDAFRLLEGLPVAIVVVDEAGAIRFVNAAAAELFGAGLGLTGRRLGDVFGEGSVVSALCDRARRTEAQLVESELTLPSGVATVAAASPSGEEGLVSLAFTPLPRKRSLAAPSNVARALAHEVRNPLAGIRAAAQLLGRSCADEDKALTTLICDEVDRVRRLTDRIDPFDVTAHAPFRAINVHEALGRVRAVVANGHPQVSIKERYDPSLPPVRGDLDQLIQAFLNIAKNAAEALSNTSPGEIVLATAFRPGMRVRLGSGSAARPLLEVIVSDNGPGLPDTVRHRLFEPFVSGKPGGMGLGLAIAAEVVSRHEGVIEAESAPGRTVFRILLPLADKESQA